MFPISYMLIEMGYLKGSLDNRESLILKQLFVEPSLVEKDLPTRFYLELLRCTCRGTNGRTMEGFRVT